MSEWKGTDGADGAPGTQDIALRPDGCHASKIPYDATASGLAATTVQEAIDELAAMIAGLA